MGGAWGCSSPGSQAGPRNLISKGVLLIFTGGHISLTVALKGPNVILGLYKCNYPLAK